MGAAWINDVSGFENPAMLAAVKDSDCKLVLMHALGVPADTRIHLPESVDAVKVLLDYAHTRIGYMEKEGIARSRIVFDPGIGFGKTPAQSRNILSRLAELKEAGLALYVGHSRKSFLGLPANAGNGARDDATLAVSKKLMEQGVDYLRVHDIARHVELRHG